MSDDPRLQPLLNKLLEILGHGGVGVVYKALHLRLNRTVAVKMLLSGQHASRDELERFLREAEAVAKLCTWGGFRSPTRHQAGRRLVAADSGDLSEL